ncbi:MAG: hypothetical protein HZC40_13600 [Chloroflexi bacterium]|nr:hypothetical protein [Chloroflexota bacterium]
MTIRKRYGSLREYLTNLNAPYPLPTKLRMIARNFSLRFVRKKACCGHHGEPGC